jgi:dolichol-phosphate mannosyltransferase
MLALGTIQLFVAGVMGEYLGRLYVETKGRPLFIIQEIVSSHPDEIQQNANEAPFQ